MSTILSQRTRDEKTEEASGRLFRAFPDVSSLAKADVEVVETLIRPVGFYRQKSRTLRELARVLLRDHGGLVPTDMESLLSLPMVGRKTANCVLVYGFGKPALPVDTHVHRISNRLGLVRTSTPEETEERLTKLIPRDRWLHVNELFVRHGQEVCHPIKPRCGDCDLKSSCTYCRRRGA